MDRQTLLFGQTIEDRFWQFHTNNPQVFAWLRFQALQLKRKGFKKYSIKTLIEVLRWRSDVSTESDDGYRLNNSFTACYARLLMQREPELEGFFETRKTRTE